MLNCVLWVDPSAAADRRIRPRKFVRRKSAGKITPPNFANRKSAVNTLRRRIFLHFIAFHHYALLILMYFLRLQTSTVWFWSLFSEGLMCIRQNFKLFCCAAYILNLIVSICLSCWPNLCCSGVFSAEFRSFRKNSAKPDISRKYGSASRILLKNSAEGSKAYRVGLYVDD